MPSAVSIPVTKMIEVHPGAGSSNENVIDMTFSRGTRIHTLRAMSGGKNCL